MDFSCPADNAAAVVAAELNKGDRETATNLINSCTLKLLNGNDDYKQVNDKMRDAMALTHSDPARSEELWTSADADFAKVAQAELKLWQSLKSAESPTSLCKLEIDTADKDQPSVRLTGDQCK